MDGAAVVESGLAQVRAGLDALLAVDLTGLGGAVVADALDALEVERRRVEAAGLRLVAEAGERYLAGDFGATTTAALLSQRLRISPGEAAARVRRAGDLMPRRALTGEVLPPILPVAAAAVCAGDISTSHAEVVAKTLDAIAADIAAEAAPVAEAMLVQAGRHEHPVRLRGTAALLLARLDPDGREPCEADQTRRRELTLARHGDGTVDIHGRLTAECGALTLTVLGALSEPRPGIDGQRDERSAAQRGHDALHDAMARLLRAGTLPDAGGTPVTVLARIDADHLDDPDALATTEHGELISMRQLRRISGDGAVQLVGTDPDGAVLWAGRTRRLANPDQRRALAVRDGGCSFPGCTMPMSWTEIHHIIAWQLGGPTDIDNLTPLCGVHHRQHQAWGWHCLITDGLPYWIPPPWIDPDQHPIRNTAHHLPEIDLSG